MKEMIPAIVIVNPEMVDPDGNPLNEARILPHAMMVHPNMLNKLLEGFKGAFDLDEFKIMTPKEYKEHAEVIYNELQKRKDSTIDSNQTKGSTELS